MVLKLFFPIVFLSLWWRRAKINEIPASPIPYCSSIRSDEVRPAKPRPFGSWKRWGEKHNEGDAYGTAKARAKATGKRFRIVDGNGNLVDLVTP